eukprot:135828_1
MYWIQFIFSLHIRLILNIYLKRVMKNIKVTTIFFIIMKNHKCSQNQICHPHYQENTATYSKCVKEHRDLVFQNYGVTECPNTKPNSDGQQNKGDDFKDTKDNGSNDENENNNQNNDESKDEKNNKENDEDNKKK